MARISRMTVEHADAPVGIDVRPRFGWTLESDLPGTRQLGWSIVVRNAAGVVWDTGEVADDRSIDLEYDGAPLDSLTRYRWTLEVGTDRGVVREERSFVTGLVDGDWLGARWISAPDDAREAPLMRAEFVVTSPPLEAYIVIGAGGYARVELDGAPIDDTVLSPGFTDYDRSAQYVVTDVTERLAPGTHAIGAELGRGFYGMRGRNTWGWESADWHAEPCVRMIVLLRYADRTEVVVSDGEWQCARGPTTFDDLYAGEDYDARRAVEGWSEPGSVQDASGWRDVRVVDGPRGLARAQRQPPIEVAESLEPSRVTQVAPDRWVVSFARVLAGRVRVRATGEAGETIELRFGERLLPDGTPDTSDDRGYFDGRFQLDRVTLAEGPLDWAPSFVWHGFQHVEVRARELPELTAEVVHTRAPVTGAFETSVPLLNRLHAITVDTILNNLHGLPTDTPTYEKNGWTGDGMLGARMMLQNLDAHELLAKWAVDIAESRHGAGAPAVIAPIGAWSLDWTPAPTWHAALLLVPWELYRQRGDERILREIWPDAEAYLRFELGRLRAGLADTTLGDWVSPDTSPEGGNAPEDTRIAATAYVVAMCDTAARICDVLSLPRREWDAAAAALRAAFQTAFWDPATGEVRGAGDDGFRQTHHVLALAFDLLPEHDRQRAADRLARDVRERGDHLWTGALGTKHLLPVLTDWGHGDVALRVALQTTYPSWGLWVERGATSLWEHWHPDSRSIGHYFLGTIDDWLFSHVVGMTPLQPGWRQIRLEPRLLDGGLSHASGRIDTPFGELACSWRLEADELHLELTIPVGSTARLVLPALETELGAGRHTVRTTG